MSVRVYLSSPLALAWTLVGLVAVGTVVAAALRLAALAARSPIVADPTVLDGFGGFLLTVAFAIAVVALAALVWLPCSLGVAYAVGSRVRGRSVSVADSIDRIYARREPLYRWVKTNAAIEPIAERILTDEDVAPTEIVVGGDAFVVPALALDAPTLRSAVDRANRTVPRSGRERVLFVGAVSTGLLVAGALAVASIGGEIIPPTRGLAVGAAVVGAVLTAAFDTAWRTGTYARQDLETGLE